MVLEEHKCLQYLSLETPALLDLERCPHMFGLLLSVMFSCQQTFGRIVYMASRFSDAAAFDIFVSSLITLYTFL